MTRLIDCMLNFWPFTAMKLCPMACKINISNVKILPKTNLTLSKWPKYLTPCQSGEISSNLVTLADVKKRSSPRNGGANAFGPTTHIEVTDF